MSPSEPLPPLCYNEKIGYNTNQEVLWAQQLM